eukprot:1658520-Lingulodinium_polyedra.AAC.1
MKGSSRAPGPARPGARSGQSASLRLLSRIRAGGHLGRDRARGMDLRRDQGRPTRPEPHAPA